MGWVIGIAAFSPFVLCLDFSNPTDNLADVTGRVTYSGRPVHETTICLDMGGVHSAFALLNPDGTFRLLNMIEGRIGAVPGRYHAHLYKHPQGTNLPAKYGDPKTSGVEIDIDADWSDLNIDLN